MSADTVVSGTRLRDAQRPVFASDTGFYADLKQHVAAYFDGIEDTRTGGLISKALVLLLWFSISYAVMLLTASGFIRFIAAVSLGLSAAGIGFNIFHDANHGSLVRGKAYNQAIAIFCSALLGPSRFLWHQKHNVFHHRFTNLHTWDDDIETRGILRMSRDQPYRPWHRFQQFYWPLVYATATVEWVFVKDFKQYFTGNLNPYLKLPAMTPAQHLEFWFTKLIYLASFLVLPIIVLGLVPALMTLAVFHLVFSLILTFVFQLAHMNDMTEPPENLTQTRSVEEEWAIHQLRTTADFAPDSFAAVWYFGGLNYQIEHHLFPGVCHRHYPELARIISDTAHSYDVPYYSYATWLEALRGHVNNMTCLSRRDPQKPVTDQMAQPK